MTLLREATAEAFQLCGLRHDGDLKCITSMQDVYWICAAEVALSSITSVMANHGVFTLFDFAMRLIQLFLFSQLLRVGRYKLLSAFCLSQAFFSLLWIVFTLHGATGSDLNWIDAWSGMAMINIFRLFIFTF